MPVLDFNLEDRSPFERVFRTSKDARLPELEIQILDGSTPVNLTGATGATFSMDDVNGTAKVNAASATISDAANGKIKYAWAAADVDTEGEFEGQFVVTQSAGKDYRIPNVSNQKLRVIIGPRVN